MTVYAKGTHDRPACEVHDLAGNRICKVCLRLIPVPAQMTFDDIIPDDPNEPNDPLLEGLEKL